MSEKNAATAGRHALTLGDEIVGRINGLAAISETPDNLTRIFLTVEHRAAADLIMAWMVEAGMSAHLDAIGNVCGRYEGDRPGLPCLMLGSHYDTVRDAGRWDGPLGLITAISCVADLQQTRKAASFCHRSDRFCRRGGGPVRVDPARQPRGGRHLQRTRAWHQKTARKSRCAKRWFSSVSIPNISARPQGRAANCWPMSSFTSNKARCSKPRHCRSGWSPRLPAPPVWRQG